MSGESEHARAGSLALLLSMIRFTIIKSTDLKDLSEWVFPSFLVCALLGGIVFGIVMVTPTVAAPVPFGAPAMATSSSG